MTSFLPVTGLTAQDSAARASRTRAATFAFVMASSGSFQDEEGVVQVRVIGDGGDRDLLRLGAVMEDAVEMGDHRAADLPVVGGEALRFDLSACLVEGQGLGLGGVGGGRLVIEGGVVRA